MKKIGGAKNKCFSEKEEESKGIPGFWLTIFKNVDMLAEMIQPHDEPILNHLQEIKVEFKEKDPMVCV
jgi:nucleosome assembly protein 1-like 1